MQISTQDSSSIKDLSTLDIKESYQDNSAEEVVYKEKELIRAIEKARVSVARGEFVTFEEVKEEFSSWVIK